MATQVQFRGGTTSEHSTFTGAAREVTIDTTKKTAVIHDGTTAGGIPLLKEANPSFTGVLSGPAGTVSAPAITTTGDTNTGIYFPAADTLAFTEGGVERMRIDSSGNVGIGNSVASTINTENNGGNLVVGAGNTSDGITIYSGNTSLGTLNFADGTTTTSTYAGFMAYYHATDAMAFGTGATERMRIDSAGNVGIGTTSIAANTRLLVSGGRTNLVANSDAFALGVGYASAGAYYLGANSANNALLFSNSAGSERMRIDDSGNAFVGGTSAPVLGYEKLGVYGTGGFKTASAYALGLWNTAGSGLISFYTDTGTLGGLVSATSGALSITGGTNLNLSSNGANIVTINTNSAERMRIDSSGSVLIANTTTVASEKLRVTQLSNNIAVFIDIAAASSTASPAISIRKQDNDNTTAQTYIGFAFNAGANGAGGIQGNGGTGVQFFSSSDKRLKENIINLDSQLNNILSIKTRKFDFIDGPKNCIGLIAQEIETIYPDVVGETPDGYKTVGGISTMEVRLIKAIQELKAELDSVKAELHTLKGN